MKPITSFLAAALLTTLSFPGATFAQTATTMYGSLSNFDVVNNTGNPTQGFEIQLEGISQQDITYTFGGTYIRYGTPTVVPYATGVYVRYMSQWNPSTQTFATSTPVAVNFPPTMGHLCFSLALGSAYFTSGCEHFGVSLSRNPITTTYRWMVADPLTPGALTTIDPPVAIAAPIWTVLPGVNNLPVVIVAEVVAPEPPAVAQFGDAQWMKVYKSELPRPAALEELLSDNPAVPQDPAALESPWVLMQARIGGNGNRNRNRNQGALGGNSQAVVRRYEFYKYVGGYDPLTHEALCVDLKCNVPANNEVGDYIGAQMAAANLIVPAQAAINVTLVGKGTVTGSVGGIKCPGICSASVAPGTSITLTAAPVGSVFTGWSGDCAGKQATCVLTVNAASAATATFEQAYMLTVKPSSKGTVTSDSGAINCGRSCSASFSSGTAVTLTATPLAGQSFSSWSGACSGTIPTCRVVIGADTQVQPNFR